MCIRDSETLAARARAGARHGLLHRAQKALLVGARSPFSERAPPAPAAPGVHPAIGAPFPARRAPSVAPRAPITAAISGVVRPNGTRSNTPPIASNRVIAMS